MRKDNELKVLKVIDSCVTQEHFKNALNYMTLYAKTLPVYNYSRVKFWSKIKPYFSERMGKRF